MVQRDGQHLVGVVESGLDSIAVMHVNVYVAVRFVLAAREAGIKLALVPPSW